MALFFPTIEDRLHFKKHHCCTDFKFRTHTQTVFYAMRRISRDKYLPPSEVKRVGYAICSHITTRPQNVLKHSYRFECEFVGMIKGDPVINIHHENYFRLVEMLKKAESVKPHKRTPFHFESVLIKFFLKYGA